MANRKIRILVVEDETIVALDLKNSLTILGYDVVATAATGEDAIARADETRPDLALMDIILRGEMDGVEAANTIRARLGIPVIFLTACADEATLHRAKVTEPFGYLLKPFEERELHGHIEIALYKHRMEKRLKESEERYSLATQGANDGLWDWNLQTQEVYYSPRWWTMLGYPENSVGRSQEDWFKRLHPGDKETVQKKLAEHVMGRTRHFESEYRILDAKGTYRWVLCRGLALRDAKGHAYRIAGSQTDITDRKVYNPLTGLPNRILLMDRLERALKRANGQPDHVFALLALEVEGVKRLNDSLGYLVADQLLIQISRRITACLSPQDTVAHCGDDEFILLLEDAKDVRAATKVATRLHYELEQPFQLEGHTVYVTANTGITLGSRDYNFPEELLRDATTALHRAKAAGKGRCEIFDGDMRSTAMTRLKLESDFRRAFDRHEFRVHYQPIVCLATGRLAGFESLVRWQRPDRLMYPDEFISVAESLDLMMPLEQWVLSESCTQLANWQRMTDDTLTVNVNISPKHYSSPNLIKDLKDVLAHTGLDPKSLRLEITESTLMESTDAISKTLAQIENMNIQVHMDDFGTGYSSLSYLHRFPISTLKIDRSFVGNLGLSEETWKIVQAIVSLARNLEMDVIAEGIENLMQMRMLQSLGCEYGQGYYFSKPLDATDAESLLSGPSPWAVAFEKGATRIFPFATQPAHPRIASFERANG
jgi:diguanylate cyclase (GGDEF)-like protein/PAS domain S-box-containing protein